MYFGRKYFGRAYYAPNYFGTGSASYTITGTIDVAPVLLGNVVVQARVSDTITVPVEVLGDLVVQQAGIITVDVELLGALSVSKAGIGPEDRRWEGGRPSTVLLVYCIDAKVPQDLVDHNVPPNEFFLIAADFVYTGGGAFAEAGARPGFIGKRIVPDVGPEYYAFRPPYEHEVVWYVDNTASPPNVDTLVREQYFLRWGDSWSVYRGKPQRVLDGQRAFEALDPDHVYDYYAKIVTSSLVQWLYDDKFLLSLGDIDECPEEFLPYLAWQVGLEFGDGDSEAAKRKKLRDAVGIYKLKGTELACALRLRDIGYPGYVREIWVNPNAPDNWYAFEDAPAYVKADIEAKGLVDQIREDSGLKGQDFIEVPHGYFRTVPTTYFPSSRVACHINNRDGSPINFAGMSEDDLNDLFQLVAGQLRVDILPVHVDIRYFVTDLHVDKGTDITLMPDTLHFTTV